MHVETLKLVQIASAPMSYALVIMSSVKRGAIKSHS